MLKKLDILTLEDETTLLPENVRHQLPSGAAPRPGRMETHTERFTTMMTKSLH
jgi:hypothetical protein